MADFKDRLQELRKAQGWTQDELAQKMKISRSTIGMYEQGTRKPDFEILDDLADLFDVSFDYMLGKSDTLSHYPRHDAAPRHLIAYYEKLTEAYKSASPDTQAAVRAILHIEDYRHGDS